MAELTRICMNGFCADNTYPDLTDYYTKNEVNDIISTIQVGGYREVDSLPQVGEPNYIYLVPKQGGGYERWIYSEDTWVDLGDTDTVYTAGDNIDISSLNEISVADSPDFTGTPTAPTNASASDDTSQLATDEFVQNAINRRLPKSNLSAYGTTSVPSGNDFVLGSPLITFPADGVYIGRAHCEFPASAVGARTFGIRANAVQGSSLGEFAGELRGAPANGGTTVYTTPVLFRGSQGTTLSPMFRQTSGSTWNLSAAIHGIFIAD